MNGTLKKTLALSCLCAPFLVKGFESKSMVGGRRSLTYSAARVIRSQIDEHQKKAMTFSSNTIKNGDFGDTPIKLGEFKILSKIVKLPVYSSKSREGFDKLYVKIGESTYPVVELPDGTFMKTLNLSEIEKFDRENHGIVRTATDLLGMERYVAIIDGESTPYAIQLDIGTLRHINKDKEGDVYLGQKVDMSKLSDSTKKAVQKSMKSIFSSGSNVLENLRFRVVD